MGSARSEVDFPSAAPQAARTSSCNLTISSIDDPVFPPDANTSTSWEVIDPACDEEVVGIINGQSQHQVNGPANANTDSDPFNQDLGLEQVSDINSANNLGTLYNQDFFVADTTNRRLSQIPNKTNYPYPLPNGHKHIHYLGHLISADGIRSLKDKLDMIRDMPAPSSSKEVKQFLGLAGYYRIFVPCFADLSRPLA